MSSFGGSSSSATRPFDNDDGYDPRLPSQRFNSSDFAAADDDDDDSVAVTDDVFSPELNGNGGFVASDGPILPPPSELESEEGFALREWRRLNVIRLEEKEKREKEMLLDILEEADEYKAEFYRRQKIACESNRAANREKQKLFLERQEKFHAEADKNYWKAIAELVPNEVPTIEKKGKKEKEKQPSIVVIQGPKPGKPTDLSRMRRILVKLKHNPPPHMKPKPPPPKLETGKDGKDAKTPSPPVEATSSSKPAAVAAPKAVSAA